MHSIETSRRNLVRSDRRPVVPRSRPMKNFTTLFTVLAFAACGGSKPAPASIEPPPVEEPAPVAAAEPTPAPEAPPPVAPPAPPPPKVTKAKAELTPVKGQKFKAATVTLSQKEGDSTSELVSSAGFEGLKAGSYHLVVHSGAECGPNATRAGTVFAGATAPIGFKADASGGAIEVPAAAVQLEGEQAVTGKVLVLHADKGGKAGKALACGPITSAAE